MQNAEHRHTHKQRIRERLHVLHVSTLHHKLKHTFPAAFNQRWTPRHWIHTALFAMIGALIATIIPGLSNNSPPTQLSSLATLALPLPPQYTSTADTWRMVTIKPGQTLSSIFNELKLSSNDMERVLNYADLRKVLTRLSPGDEISFDIPNDGQLRGMRFNRDEKHRVELTIDDNTIHQQVSQRQTSTRTVIASGEIKSSLWIAAREADLSPVDVITLTDEIFKYDIDFDKDLQIGDRFSVVMDETWREGERLPDAKILAATFNTGGKIYSGIRFMRDGKVEYFDKEGRPLKKSFIRMPISYARLSSTFGLRRHPILGTMRMHKGVDYAAATGTPIMAAGDARVQFIGQQRGYGNVVILNHGKGYRTLYGHMSRFGKIKAGQKINQGTVIGYVGMTGLATGPHLHYEFQVNGQHRNPLSITMPPPEPLRGKDLIAFRTQTAPLIAQIQQYEKRFYAITNKHDSKSTEKSTRG